jgi:hypothetical protein
VQIFDNNDMKHHSDADSAQNWRKSSRSMTNGNCVEVAGPTGQSIGVRDSMNPTGAVLGFTLGEWDAFVGSIRNGKFDGNR